MDMFPQTTKQRKRLCICSHARKNSKDIRHIQTTHVETCCLLERLRNAKDYIPLKLDMEDYYKIKDEMSKGTVLIDNN